MGGEPYFLVVLVDEWNLQVAASEKEVIYILMIVAVDEVYVCYVGRAAMIVVVAV